MLFSIELAKRKIQYRIILNYQTFGCGSIPCMCLRTYLFLAIVKANRHTTR